MVPSLPEWPSHVDAFVRGGARVGNEAGRSDAETDIYLLCYESRIEWQRCPHACSRMEKALVKATDREIRGYLPMRRG
ncbi:hypothetical protein GCM10027167_66150 [Nocardia heshunensis]